jgi:hypothetical protein
MYRELHQFAGALQDPTIVKEDMYVFNSPIMSYILNMLICVGMILLDYLLQCFLLIDVIDVLICNSLVMFMRYFWIKLKLKVSIFQTIQKPYCWHFI